MQVIQIRDFQEAPESAATAYATSLEGRDEQKYIKSIRKAGHHTIMEHNVFHLELRNITLAAAEVVGSCRAGFSMVERSLRRTKSIDMYYPSWRHEALVDFYNKELERGIKKEDARYILPDNILTTCRITINQLELENLMIELTLENRHDCLELMGKLSQLLRFPMPDMDLDPDAHIIHKNTEREPYVNINIDDRDEANASHRRYPEFSDTTIYDTLSRVAYQQLKRHRMMSLLPEPYDTKRLHFPYTSSLADEAAQLAAEDNIVIGATKRWFKMKINHRSLANFFDKRCDKHAQKEIRDWAIELRSKHAFCKSFNK